MEVTASPLDAEMEEAGSAHNTDCNSLATANILCDECNSAVEASQLLVHPTKESSEPFRRYHSINHLSSSATQGCHLCSLVLCSLAKSSRSDTDLAGFLISIRVTNKMRIIFRIESDVVGSEKKRQLGVVYVKDPDELDRNAEPGPEPSFFTFSKDNDESPNGPLQHPAQLVVSTSSGASASLAREWLQQCLQNHPKCKAGAAMSTSWCTRAPAYLLDVDGTDKIRLVSTRNLAAPLPKYLALSHCWGGAEILRLLNGNLDAMEGGFPISTLPKTFRDSVAVTRNLRQVSQQARAVLWYLR